MTHRSFVLLAALLLGSANFWGCANSGPHGKLEHSCAEACEARASNCSSHECQRGCRFILDRLVEKQGDNVIACVAKAKKCDDKIWADCAVRIGPHADGGPPVPERIEDP